MQLPNMFGFFLTPNIRLALICELAITFVSTMLQLNKSNKKYTKCYLHKNVLAGFVSHGNPAPKP